MTCVLSIDSGCCASNAARLLCAAASVIEADGAARTIDQRILSLAHGCERDRQAVLEIAENRGSVLISAFANFLGSIFCIAKHRLSRRTRLLNDLVTVDHLRVMLARFTDDLLRALLRFPQHPVFVFGDQLRAADLLRQRRTHLLDQLEDAFLAQDSPAEREHGAFPNVGFQSVDHAVNGHPASLAV